MVDVTITCLLSNCSPLSVSAFIHLEITVLPNPVWPAGRQADTDRQTSGGWTGEQANVLVGKLWTSIYTNPSENGNLVQSSGWWTSLWRPRATKVRSFSSGVKSKTELLTKARVSWQEAQQIKYLANIDFGRPSNKGILGTSGWASVTVFKTSEAALIAANCRQWVCPLCGLNHSQFSPAISQARWRGACMCVRACMRSADPKKEPTNRRGPCIDSQQE